MNKKIIGISIALVALIVLSFTVRKAVYYAPADTEVTPPVVAGATTSAGLTTASVTAPERPLRLSIPSLKVSANVQYVGIKENGAMANPKGFKDVGWYKLGTVPGREGSAVMAGHVDNGLALNGVFKRLADLNLGDDVYVTTNGGKKLHFKVTDIKEYPYKEAPSQKIFATSGGKYLNLITCSGTWISSEKSYDKRLVVYTTLVE